MSNMASHSARSKGSENPFSAVTNLPPSSSPESDEAFSTMKKSALYKRLLAKYGTEKHSKLSELEHAWTHHVQYQKRMSEDISAVLSVLNDYDDDQMTAENMERGLEFRGWTRVEHCTSCEEEATREEEEAKKKEVDELSEMVSMHIQDE
ncbi:hypothetical protein BD324DRAFT_635887 [Kockovaella imperatae]|uniref:Uncharacterized protein n=1 Tax=Kockovaella imperatae TaxID=4999 RepID=A0A1Y1UA85_9TREE|nr:hypothetical protein BD324DRAFT_635887 [Kockovaella imperatae]ORX34427.1 hypothetical protein BD324DRAFT_635887 [Kockovaella imperatae]